MTIRPQQNARCYGVFGVDTACRWLACAIVGVLCGGLSTPSHAIKIQTEAFYEMCGEKIDTVEQDINRVICLSYMQGLIDAHDAMITLFPPAVLFCAPPPGVDVDHARQIFLAWISENKADYQSRPADITIISALNAAFPCAN